MMKYDPTINLGHILTFFGFMCAGGAAYYDARVDIRLQGQEISQQEQKIDILSESVSNLAIHAQKIQESTRQEMVAWFMRFDDKLEKLRESKAIR